MAESSPTILEVDDLRRHYGGVRAVDGASFTVQRGSITSLIGPNGAGKTTAFNLLTGFARPDTGRVVFEGSDVAGHRSDRVARPAHRRAHLPQPGRGGRQFAPLFRIHTESRSFCENRSG